MSDIKFTEDHEWIRLEDGAAVVGITDYAQDQLGEIVFVELPSPGDTVTKDETFGVVESVKAASDIYAPVSGDVRKALVHPARGRTERFRTGPVCVNLAQHCSDPLLGRAFPPFSPD